MVTLTKRGIDLAIGDIHTELAVFGNDWAVIRRVSTEVTQWATIW